MRKKYAQLAIFLDYFYSKTFAFEEKYIFFREHKRNCERQNK